jgi:hypothetical protein
MGLLYLYLLHGAKAMSFSKYLWLLFFSDRVDIALLCSDFSALVQF